jgi:NAD(P)-dependent dehydrogenase (short-subunit alcohol dehydrogenase family)
MDFDGKHVVVTGGGRGIGRAISLALARAGATVTINYVRNADAARATCADIVRAGGSAEAVAADVGDPDGVRRLFDAVRAHGHVVDGLVHNAAIGRFKPLVRVRPCQWDLAFRTNAQALLLMVREALSLFAPAGASIVALSSLGSHRYVPHYGAVGASKAALESIVRTLAYELGPRGIRVNAVSGGLVDSEWMRALPRSDELYAEVRRRTPLGRLGEPADLADVVLFLMSPKARWVCGQTVVADGGFSLS